MPTLFKHGHGHTSITGGDFARLKEQCPWDLLNFAILGPLLSSGRQTRSKTDKLFINFQLYIADLGSTAIEGHGKLSSHAKVKTLKTFHEGKPSTVCQILAGIVKHQQGLVSVGFNSHDWCHGFECMVRGGFEFINT